MTERILPSSSLNYRPTAKQIRAITRMAAALRITDPIENSPANRREARDLIFELRKRLKEGKQ